MCIVHTRSFEIVHTMFQYDLFHTARFRNQLQLLTSPPCRESSMYANVHVRALWTDDVTSVHTTHSTRRNTKINMFAMCVESKA